MRIARSARLTSLCLGPMLLALDTGCADQNEALELLDEVQGADYREEFVRAPGWEEPRVASTAPHGDFVDIYVNEIVADALENEEDLAVWPVGSLIVKDGWEDAEGTQLRYIALMERRTDGWFWAEYDSNENVDFAGLNESVCTGCHASGEDQVRAFGLP